MEFQVNFKINDSIYIKDPESSEIGKKIVQHSIDLIHTLGFEHFTFKKLAEKIDTTEATVYRYFESKHRVLLYILNWYWSYMEFLLLYKLQNVEGKRERLMVAIQLLTQELPDKPAPNEYNKKSLNQIVIAESSKVYLIKEVTEINKQEVFKPYKELCARLAELIHAFNPKYKYPKSLSSTLIESAHQQQFFSTNLPRLTDNPKRDNTAYTRQYIQDLLFKVLA